MARPRIAQFGDRIRERARGSRACRCRRCRHTLATAARRRVDAGGRDRDKVAAILRYNKLNAYISPVRNGCAVVAEEQADTQATAPIVSLAELLSIEAQAPVLAVLNHDDDALLLGLHVSGQEVTDYSSDPDFVPQDTGTSLAGRATELCAKFDASHAVEAVTTILSGTWQTYGCAFERHQALVEALGLSDFAVCHGFGDLKECPADAVEWLNI
jgi:hypothetical protein